MDSDGEAPAAAPARLTRRVQYLRVAGGIRVHTALFTLQAVRPGEDGVRRSRVGLTVTKRAGTATERNRIRRRLREALRRAKALSTATETDYVVVARREVLSSPFDRLVADLDGAVVRADGKLREARRRGPASRRPGSGAGKAVADSAP